MQRAILVSMWYLVLGSVAFAGGAPRAKEKRPEQASAALNRSASMKRTAQNVDENEPARRCAFLGRCGSFTVIGANGTAAYRLGNGQFIADLRSAGEDANWWLYRPVGSGDPSTVMWAFARFPRCGRYRVLRFANGAWRFYEQTEAWGNGLGQSGGLQASFEGPTNTELLNKLQAIEGKLNDIQRSARPSLNDLEDLIKKTK